MEEVETLTQEVLRIVVNSPHYAVSLKVDFPANVLTALQFARRVPDRRE